MIILFSISCKKEDKATNKNFIKVEGMNLVTPNGEKFFIRGINLGNWLNPEGYMFFLKDVNSYRLINDMFCEMVGPDFTNWFWQEFQANYITHEDIKYIKQTGMNSIRLPFHYKLFTDDDYMGKKSGSTGFEIFDRVLNWCKQENLYVVLDMHVAPGGQTGDNIDDSYGYPWLFGSESDKELFCSIWKQIAERYADETIILGYDLMNEPIAHYFEEDYHKLNTELEPLYKKCVASIRSVDKNHIILLGGAQWNSNFRLFTDSKFDDNIIYTCHRYKCDTLKSNIQDLINFRDSVNLPMYMGETGENTDEWVCGFRRLLEDNNIGWHFWPYKKMATRACMTIIPTPENWDVVLEYSKMDRSSFAKIRESRPSPDIVKKAMLDLLENMKLYNCIKNEGYVSALGMNP